MIKWGLNSCLCFVDILPMWLQVDFLVIFQYWKTNKNMESTNGSCRWWQGYLCVCVCFSILFTWIFIVFFDIIMCWFLYPLSQSEIEYIAASLYREIFGTILKAWLFAHYIYPGSFHNRYFFYLIFIYWSEEGNNFF